MSVKLPNVIIEKDDYAEIVLKYKNRESGKQKNAYVKIDLEDVKKIQFKKVMLRSFNGILTPMIEFEKTSTKLIITKLERYLAGFSPLNDNDRKFIIKSINGDIYDLRKDNLSIDTLSLHKLKLYSGKEKSVYLTDYGYISFLCAFRKKYYLGRFPTKEEAARAQENARANTIDELEKIALRLD